MPSALFLAYLASAIGLFLLCVASSVSAWVTWRKLQHRASVFVWAIAIACGLVGAVKSARIAAKIRSTDTWGWDVMQVQLGVIAFIVFAYGCIWFYWREVRKEGVP